MEAYAIIFSFCREGWRGTLNGSPSLLQALVLCSLLAEIKGVGDQTWVSHIPYLFYYLSGPCALKFSSLGQVLKAQRKHPLSVRDSILLNLLFML